MNRFTKEQYIGEKPISSSRKRICGNAAAHFHNFYEIEYVIRGSGEYIINGKSVPCSDGMLFFMTPVDYHSVRTASSEIYNTMFSGDIVDFRFLKPFLRHSGSKAFLIEPGTRAFVEEILHEIVENEESED